MNAAAQHLQSVLLHRRTSDNAFGEPVFAPAEAIACRFERAGKLVTRRNGTTELSNAALYTTARIEEGDRVQYQGKTYPVLAVSAATNLRGEFVQNEAYLGVTRRIGTRN